MSAPTDRHPRARWLLPFLVVLLVLGHVCDLSSFAALDAHHPVDGHADEELASCDAVPATSCPSHGQMWPMPVVAAALPTVDAAPASAARSIIGESRTRVDRPPLFLLFASFLI